MSIIVAAEHCAQDSPKVKAMHALLLIHDDADADSLPEGRSLRYLPPPEPT